MNYTARNASEQENEDDLPALELSEEASAIVDREDAANYKLVLSASTNLNLLICVYALEPIIRILLHWYGLKPLDGTALPFMCFNPFVLPITPDVIKVSHLVILSLPQWIYLYDATMAVQGGHTGVFFCVGNVLVDMKVLKCELNEMRALLELKLNIQSLAVEEESINDNWKDLDHTLRQICCHHQTVFRKIKEINKLYTFPIIIMNTIVGFYICVGVYCVVKAEEFSTIITHCVMTFTGIFFCHITCENGQRIETEGENLRMALYDCYVVGSRHVLPPWYHRSLLMMLLRHDSPPCLSPLKIFRLNRTSLKVILQGALSYFNVLNNLSE